MERVGHVLKLDYLDVHNIRYTLEKGELSLLQFFEMQEHLLGISLWGLKDILLPQEHHDLKELIWNTLKDYKK
ncbi:hypothetical protein D3C78_1735540 [compost metagenome]